jgi:aspartate carbamoyltransferase catalytic subunit
MYADAIIIRHTAAGAPHYVSKFCRSHIINAGDGAHEHPTQALLDAYTIKQKKKKFEGLKIVIVGDILHSRVARSNIICLHKLGAHITLSGPPALVPESLEKFKVEVNYDMDRAVEDADVIMMLRIQKERQQKNSYPSIREYRFLYSLTEKKLKKAKKKVIIMHPGPVNKGVELTSDLASSDRSVILKQVENGVSVRMAVLYLLLGGKERETTD